MWLLRQSTAGQEIPLGPFLDAADGNTAETALTVANTDVRLLKAGATAEVAKNAGGATHLAAGRYYAVLDAADTDTVGPMRVSAHVAGALAVWLDCCVLDEAVFDVLFGSAAPSTFAGGAVAAVTGNVGGSVAGSVGSVAAGGITAASLAADCITAAKIAPDAIDADALKADAVAEIQAGLATAAAVAAVGADTQNLQARLPAALVAGRIAADAVAVSGSSAAADALEANVGRLDAAVSTRQAAFTASTGVTLPAAVAAVGSPMTLAAGERDAVAAALLDLAAGVEDGQTVRQTLRGLAAALLGNVSADGAGYFAPDGTTQRLAVSQAGPDGRAVTRTLS